MFVAESTTTASTKRAHFTLRALTKKMMKTKGHRIIREATLAREIKNSKTNKDRPTRSLKAQEII